MAKTERIPKLTDKELAKWTGILGAKEIIYLYMKAKIQLTSEQLDTVIEEKEKGN